MYIFRQNRYVTLLIGAILVSFGAICLLQQNDYEQERSGNQKSTFMKEYINTEEIVASAPTKRSRTFANQGEKLSQLSLPNLTTLEIKTQSLELGISQSQMLQELAAERELLRKRRAEAVVKETVPDKFNPPNQLFFTRTELLSPENKDDATWVYVLNEEELLLLQKIVMAEAEGEPYEGKVAVANVVLNRLRSANYPDTIKEVIYQKSQFSPVRNGRLKKVKPNEDTIHAVNEALNGRKEVRDDTYYFLSLKLATDLTIARTKDKAKVIGNHTFYK